ncbi:DUF6891 domain-containing protein [Empedobacter falsenii]|uniref:DUF6891 domain-containing protein n=1 Tax=Empedobacter TaxID=59734 RepID=UPI00257734DD|nr:MULTISPECIES: hypothetical protein [Empedobacter]MDM1039960.1 hypothetical protein [Empedobacter brevis]MDM1133892.1 hypothetical protein [Empedobacter sp. R750]
MTENEAFIYESIENQVRMGFLSLDEIKDNILDEIEDNEFENEISEDWATQHIEAEWQSMLNETKTWKSPTDIERLIAAFDELCDQNIIALHNAGYTTSDGEYEVVDVERKLQDNGIVSDGYCFYHEQDLSRAIAKEDPSLYIAFQKVDNEDDDVTIAVGKKVVEVLKKHQFEVDWNESPTSKILIPNFKWELFYDENNVDLLDYEAVAKHMIAKK